MGMIDFFTREGRERREQRKLHRDIDPGYWPHNDGYQSWTPLTQGTRGNPWQHTGYMPHIGDTPEASAMPHIRAIAAQFANLDVIAVDLDGNPLDEKPAAVRALDHPNAQHTRIEFLHHIAQQILLRPHVDVLVWHDLGKEYLEPAFDTIYPANIAGYTILPAGSRVYHKDGTYHLAYMVQGYEAVSLPGGTINLTYQLDPDNPYEGLSAVESIRTWTDIDALIADYERGFFTNGAIPAGAFNIVAPTREAFDETRKEMDKRLTGAGRQSAIYNFTPIDPATGAPATPKITWTPYQTTNDSLDLQTLADLTDRRITQGIAVPEIVRGLDTGQTYANAEQAVKTFTDATLAPLAKRIFERFTFDIETGAGLPPGGLGWKFKADLPEATLSEARKTEAQVKEINTRAWATLIGAGMTAESAARVLDLGEEWAEVEFVESEPVEPAAPVTVNVQNHIPASFGKPPSEDEDKPVWDNPVPFVKGGSDDSVTADVEAAIVAAWEAVAVESGEETTDTEDALVEGLAEALLPLLLVAAQGAQGTVRNLVESGTGRLPDAGFVEERLKSYDTWETLPERVRELFIERLRDMARSIIGTVRSRLHDIRTRAGNEGWSETELRDTVNSVVADRERAARIAQDALTDTRRYGEVWAVQEGQRIVGVPFVKVWHAHNDSKTCSVCAGMDGERRPVGEFFVKHDDVVEIGEGVVWANTWLDVEAAGAHPNCRCWLSFEVDWGRVENG